MINAQTPELKNACHEDQVKLAYDAACVNLNAAYNTWADCRDACDATSYAYNSAYRTRAVDRAAYDAAGDAYKAACVARDAAVVNYTSAYNVSSTARSAFAALHIEQGNQSS